MNDDEEDRKIFRSNDGGTSRRKSGRQRGNSCACPITKYCLIIFFRGAVLREHTTRGCLRVQFTKSAKVEDSRLETRFRDSRRLTEYPCVTNSCTLCSVAGISRYTRNRFIDAIFNRPSGSWKNRYARMGKLRRLAAIESNAKFLYSRTLVHDPV